jgi:hypothetical protein
MSGGVWAFAGGSSVLHAANGRDLIACAASPCPCSKLHELLTDDPNHQARVVEMDMVPGVRGDQVGAAR